MKTKLVLVLIGLIYIKSIQLVHAQVVFNKVVYGQDSVNDYCNDVMVLPSGKIAICGSFFNPLNTTHLPGNILLLESNGDTIWKRDYEYALNAGNQIKSLTFSDDNYIVSIGTTKDTMGITADLMLQKVDTLGNLL